MIRVYKLIEYHRIGFKLIPICDDGKTPNVSGILTAEEEQTSIKEPKSGKVEPVNYIYSHTEFWTEEMLIGFAMLPHYLERLISEQMMNRKL